MKLPRPPYTIYLLFLYYLPCWYYSKQKHAVPKEQPVLGMLTSARRGMSHRGRVGRRKEWLPGGTLAEFCTSSSSECRLAARRGRVQHILYRLICALVKATPIITTGAHTSYSTVTHECLRAGLLTGYRSICVQNFHYTLTRDR